MTTLNRRQFIKAGACAAGMAAISGSLNAATTPRPAVASSQLSHFDLINGVSTLVVDGAPFLITGAQCDVWRSTYQDASAEAFFDGYSAMHATTVGTDILWSKIEVSEGEYDFAFLDWFIHQAEKHSLKLVLHLFGSNVCGKMQEGSGASAYPVYVPSYIRDAPDRFQRMILPGQYVPEGPAMCPNDPRTLERERLYVEHLAKYLKERDNSHTVVLAQVENEPGCWTWNGDGPDRNTVRCTCPYCNKKWAASTFDSPYTFMVESFADYVRVLSDNITRVYPLPLYVNSPWYPPETVRTFLERCPHIAMVGIDGIFSTEEPNILVKSQVSRNIPFAAECPTENPKTRFNLDVLPYYSIIGELGIGFLLWEAHAPNTVVDDAEAVRRFAHALYPIKSAMTVIARTRGTSRLSGWFARRDFETSLFKTMFAREGAQCRVVDDNVVDIRIGDAIFTVRESNAGIIALLDSGDLVVASPSANLTLRGIHFKSAETGRFEGERWAGTEPLLLGDQTGAQSLNISTPSVVLLRR